jgi:hypothetical protein
MISNGVAMSVSALNGFMAGRKLQGKDTAPPLTAETDHDHAHFRTHRRRDG